MAGISVKGNITPSELYRSVGYICINEGYFATLGLRDQVSCWQYRYLMLVFQPNCVFKYRNLGRCMNLGMIVFVKVT